MIRFYTCTNKIDASTVIPDWLYCYDDSVTYSNTFTGGEFDVERCLARRPCWKAEACTARKPKAIVLNDESLSKLAHNELDSISLRDVLSRLLSDSPQPFLIYLCHDETLFEINKDNLYLLSNNNFCRKLGHIVEDDLYVQLKEKNISRSESLLLDKGGVDALVMDMYKLDEESKKSVLAEAEEELREEEDISGAYVNYSSCQIATLDLCADNYSNNLLSSFSDLRRLNIRTGADDISKESIASYNFPETASFPNLHHINIDSEISKYLAEQYRFASSVVASTECLESLTISGYVDISEQYYR